MHENKLPSKEELRKLLSQDQFLELIIAQLNKDLGSMYEGVKTRETEDVVSDLVNQLRVHLIGLERIPGNRLQDLMYRVDLSADQFFNTLNDPAIDDPYRVLAGKILDREMQKVWFRLNYKS